MNIFVLDINPKKAAQYACDVHCVKMITESAQMLSTAHRVNSDGKLIDALLVSNTRDKILYKPTHINHPCNVWIRKSVYNYIWLYNYYIALGKEYDMRFNYLRKFAKEHKAYNENLRNILYYVPFHMNTVYDFKDENDYLIQNSLLFDNVGVEATPPPLCMPDHIADPFRTNYSWENTVAAYRQYYIQDKSRFAKWKHSNTPEWYIEGIRNVNDTTKLQTTH